jgi:hypothetical protein
LRPNRGVLQHKFHRKRRVQLTQSNAAIDFQILNPRLQSDE